MAICLMAPVVIFGRAEYRAAFTPAQLHALATFCYAALHPVLLHPHRAGGPLSTPSPPPFLLSQFR
jgi:hypothetical protein